MLGGFLYILNILKLGNVFVLIFKIVLGRKVSKVCKLD